MLILDPDLRPGLPPSFRSLFSSPGLSVAIRGDILGYVDGDATLAGAQAEERLLAAIREGKPAQDVMRWTLGSYVLAVFTPGAVTLAASPIGPGCYLVRKGGRLAVAFNDRDMARAAGRGAKVSFMEVLHAVFSKPFPSRPPCTTLFDNAARLPGGAMVRIEPGLDWRMDFYIHQAPQPGPHTYARFARIFEDTARLACGHAAGRPLYAMVSGGIDSAAVLLAAQAAGFRPTAFHWRKSQALNSTVDLLCSLAGAPLVFHGRNYFVPDPLKLDWDRARGLYESALGVMGFNQVLTGMAGLPGAFLTGMAFGNILQVNAAMRVCFGEGWLRRTLMDMKLKVPLRRMYLDGFMNSVRRGQAAKWLDRPTVRQAVQGLAAPGGIRDYLYNLAYTNERPCLGPSPLPDALRPYAQEYARYVESALFRRVLGPELHARVVSDNGQGLGNAEVLNAARLIRFATQVQRTSKNDGCYAAFGGYSLLSIPMEGPILSFCMTRPLGWRDVLAPKRFLFRYFKERLGVSYGRFLSMDRTRRRRGPGRDLGGGFAPGETPKPLPALLFESRDFSANFPRIVDPADSALIDSLEHGEHRDVMASVYRECRAAPSNFQVCNQLLNLELFLRANPGES